ncbi:MAG: AAA family ATPase [Sulfurovum sp.]|nr:AAA family ATPase [Sulfurovum sp.]
MKFKIHKLARIEDATFEIKDLTVFVGKNSTNKSYVAHIVYILNKILSKFNDTPYRRQGLFNELFIKYIKNIDSQLLIEEIKNLKKKESISEREIQVDEGVYEWEEIREVSYDFKSFNSQKLIDNIQYFLISLIIEELNKSFNTNKKVLEEIVLINCNVEPKSIVDKDITIQSIDEEFDHIRLLQLFFRKILNEFFKQKASNEEFYFPASRTGFILAFDEIVSGVLRDRFGGQPTATKLTEPTIDFISGFSDIKSGKFGDEISFLRHSLFDDTDHSSRKKMKKLFEFIENRIIKGKIVEEKKEQNYTQFYLQPKNSEKLELHLTSSATVELLPLVIFLKHFSKIKDRLLVIEEPEAHLHPKAQIEMARLIVMLVNAGAKVLITTHSDYILNELSNCIKLSEANEKNVDTYLKKHELSKETIIGKDRVSAYLFKDMNRNTEVQDLNIDKYGIANDNFDDILDELLDRTEEINEILEN